MIERYKLFVKEPYDGFIYLDNPSPMTLVDTRKIYEDVLGKESVEYYFLGFLEGFSNAFKFNGDLFEKVKKEILINCVKDEEGYYIPKDSLTAANEI